MKLPTMTFEATTPTTTGSWPATAKRTPAPGRASGSSSPNGRPTRAQSDHRAGRPERARERSREHRPGDAAERRDRHHEPDAAGAEMHVADEEDDEQRVDRGQEQVRESGEDRVHPHERVGADEPQSGRELAPQRHSLVSRIAWLARLAAAEPEQAPERHREADGVGEQAGRRPGGLGDRAADPGPAELRRRLAADQLGVGLDQIVLARRGSAGRRCRRC